MGSSTMHLRSLEPRLKVMRRAGFMDIYVWPIRTTLIPHRSVFRIILTIDRGESAKSVI